MTRSRPLASGSGIGALSGLVGLGGAEFRLPLMIGAFPLRSPGGRGPQLGRGPRGGRHRAAVPRQHRAARGARGHWPVVLSLLAGGLLGAWLGAGWATRLKWGTLYRVIAVLLVGIALVLVLGQGSRAGEP